ncbi:recombinase family protein [Cytobacillus firmus]|uniref:recombinase family protein n=1 Tax=Cytobacillus firmus TaxID=1399 RepID=UPI0018CCA285|nr:recombinase family protein [Cytobacillus firmus]MBG9588302.1 hypothetical protein [Cytobacillus firmus]
MEKHTAITYARKSVKVKGISVEQGVSYQQVTIEEYAKKNNMNIIKKYSDIGYSGASLERPELLEMLNDLKLSQVDYLLVYSVDRFGRDLVNNIDTMLEILDLVKHVVFITESFSSSSEYFKMFFLILTAISQEERERLLSRVKEGRRVKVLIREAYDGKYPLGYVKMASSEVISPVNEETSDDLSKIQEIHILKYIFYGYLCGLSLRKIAKVLNEQFGPTKRMASWSYKSVKYILTNRHYSGYLTGVLENKQHYYIKSNNIVPVIDPLLHEKIIAMVNHETRGRKKSGLLHIPSYCLCKTCGYSINQIDNMFTCKNCNYNLPIKGIFEKVMMEIKELIQNNKVLDKHTNHKTLLKQYRRRLKKLHEQESQLLKNKEIIDTAPYFDKFKREELIKLNTEELSKVKKEIVVHSQLESVLIQEESLQLTNQYLIHLPFLLIIDGLQKGIDVLFHPNIFVENTL